MAEAQQTSVRVRVQARGGKFLGPGVKYAQVSVLNAGKEIFGPDPGDGDSGVVDAQTGTPIPQGASRNAIVVQPSSAGPPEGAYWLQPDDATAGVVATFPLDAPALLEFRATALWTTDTPVTTSTQMWVVPGLQLTAEPGVVLTIPGLHATVAATVGDTVAVTATVTMMCGCPITEPTWPQASGGPEPYWPATEFQVQAVLTAPDGTQTTQGMAFQTTNTFTASFPVPPSGTSTIAVCAVQAAECNVGYAETTITV